MTEQKTKHLKFFGIGKILPLLQKFRMQIMIMVLCGLLSSGVDILLPMFQRYALDYYVGNKIFDTILPFVLAYLATIGFASVVNYLLLSGYRH